MIIRSFWSDKLQLYVKHLTNKVTQYSKWKWRQSAGVCECQEEDRFTHHHSRISGNMYQDFFFSRVLLLLKYSCSRNMRYGPLCHVEGVFPADASSSSPVGSVVQPSVYIYWPVGQTAAENLVSDLPGIF